jgi:Ca2+:H+ antiporter
MANVHSTPPSSWVFPALAIGLFGLAAAGVLPGGAVAVALLPVLFGTVFAAVHHAEVIGARTGEPYGTLVLTMAVTIIEVALIASVMLGEAPKPALARDTVFAVVMIVVNGVVGLCIVIGALHHGEQSFRVTGASAYLTVLVALAVITMVLPNYTVTEAGPVYAPSQLVFVSIATLVLYAVFLWIQTVRHKEHFLPTAASDTPVEPHERPAARQAAISLGLLVLALAGVILLSKPFGDLVGLAVARAGAPEAVIGVLVAMLVLLPEFITAVRSARADRLQQSLNLALGSSLATIGLTVPAVAAMSFALGTPLVLGLSDKESVLLALTIVISLLTFGTGRTTILHGFVHLVLFATFVFLTFVP